MGSEKELKAQIDLFALREACYRTFLNVVQEEARVHQRENSHDDWDPMQAQKDSIRLSEAYALRDAAFDAYIEALIELRSAR